MMPGSVGRVCAFVLAVGLLALGRASAQAPPGSALLPAPSPVPAQAAPPPPLLETPPSPFVTASAPLPEPVNTGPLPDSTEDQLLQEYRARQGFRTTTWQGTVITAFPNSLLWTPPLASKREPRFQLLRSSLDNYASNWTLDTSIGNTVGLYRFQPIGRDLAFQFDLFALVQTRLSPEDLLASDYRFGFPLSWRWGVWHGKFAYEHTSAHLGDERIRHFQDLTIPASATAIPSFAKDEAVVGVGRWFADQLRVYGQVSYAWLQAVPYAYLAKSKYRFDAGFEWYAPNPTGWSGQPFLAFNWDTRGDQGYGANYNFQAGWMWRNPFQRLANVRIFGEYYTGYSPFNIMYLTKEKFYSVGISCDY
jgi:hypothetical protein